MVLERRAGVDRSVVLLVLLLAAWLVWFPPSPDLAAQVYRIHLFSTDGFSLWDNNWYGGHYLPDYSLLFPPLATLVSLQVVGVVSVTCSTLAFRRLAKAHFGSRASRATALFAVSACGDLFIGRLTFALGVMLGVASVLAIATGHRKLTVLLSLACAAASPVAALFLALAAAADLLTHRAFRRALTLAGPALGLTLALTLLFPEGGYEPFALTALLAAAGASLALILLLPARERLLRRGAQLYLLALLLSYAVRSPMGSNAVRFGVLFAPAILAGCVEVKDMQRAFARLSRCWQLARRHDPAHASRIGRVSALWLLGLLSTALVLWQLDGPLVQSVQASNERSARFSFYKPVIRYLENQSRGAPMRIEVAFISSHWDAVILGRRFFLARGWERQLDMKNDALFYEPRLTTSAYHDWLLETGVRFVVLSDAPLDYSSRQEAALIRGGLPFLHQVFKSAHWHIYAVRGARPLASGPGELTAMDEDGFTLYATRPGTFLVRVHYTPYWKITSGLGRVSEAQDGWTRVTAEGAGKIAIDAEFSLTA